MRALATSPPSPIDHRNGSGIEIGIIGPRPEHLPEPALGYLMRLAVTGWVTETKAISIVRIDVAARFGTRNAQVFVGPSLGWWDGARNGAAVGAGAELGARIYLDPRW